MSIILRKITVDYFFINANTNFVLITNSYALWNFMYRWNEAMFSLNCMCFPEHCGIISQIKLYVELLKILTGHIPNSEGSLQDYVAS